MARVERLQGDYQTQAVGAVVNAANTTLLGGGGVDGAIHRAAGPELLEECRTIGGCPTGEARITKAYRLAAKHVIHTVGPVWSGGRRGGAAPLRGGYGNPLPLPAQRGPRAAAFPPLRTRAHGHPLAPAPGIACPPR